VVREKTIVEAMRLMLFSQHEVVEGSGAVGVAALIEQAERFEGKKVGVVLSGGNVESSLLRELAAHA
jgi:threonine dehydratase